MVSCSERPSAVACASGRCAVCEALTVLDRDAAVADRRVVTVGGTRSDTEGQLTSK